MPGSSCCREGIVRAAAAGVEEAPAGILMGLHTVFRRFGVGGCLDAPCRWGLGAGFGSGMRLKGVDGGLEGSRIQSRMLLSDDG